MTDHRALLEEAGKALEPFAEAADRRSWHGRKFKYVTVRQEHCEAAREALRAISAEPAPSGGKVKLAEALVQAVEGFPGYGTLRNADGVRLKDHPAWVAFYINATKSAEPAAPSVPEGTEEPPPMTSPPQAERIRP